MSGLFLKALGAASRYGRAALVAGLLAGFVLPSVANLLKPWLPHLVMGLLFLVALRIGPERARRGMINIRATLGVVLIFQLGLPLCVIALSLGLGIAQSAYVMAIVLVFSAPALSGSPSLSLLLGADPEPAFRLLVVGTALLPFTVLPIFLLMPQFGDTVVAITSAARALVAIVVAMGCGFLVRAFGLPRPTQTQFDALDGATTVALAVIVIGLMAALRPALANSFGTVAVWMALAFAVNIGTQMLSYLVLRNYVPQHEVVPISIVAGNRNIAIFLVALSPSASEPLLVFIGCYQVPMYLTPILMNRLYHRGARLH